MALTRNEILEIRERCRETMARKSRCALEGHDWVVDSQVMSSAKLAELSVYALWGERVLKAWFAQGVGSKMPDIDLVPVITFPVSAE